MCASHTAGAEPQQVMPADDRLQVRLRLDPGLDSDASETDLLTRRLRQQLLLLEVDSVEPVTQGPAPDGARAIEVMAIGALVATMAKSPELLKTVCGSVQAWLGASHSRSVEL